MKDKFYVMYCNKSAVSRFTKILETANQKCAERIARRINLALNDKLMERVMVWTQTQFDQWQEAESMLAFTAHTFQNYR